MLRSICSDFRVFRRAPTDLKWQDVFRFWQPGFLPAGTTIAMEYVYDNSRQNPRNPLDPPRRVTYGERDDRKHLMLPILTGPR